MQKQINRTSTVKARTDIIAFYIIFDNMDKFLIDFCE